MVRKIIFVFAICNLLLVNAQQKPAYMLYKANGKKISYRKMVRSLKKADIILFGEHHNNPIVHWLQYEITNDLSKKRKLVLGAEMIETDNQEALNSYLKGEINQKQLDSLARLWNNYRTDYKPLVDFAKKNKIDFIATNIPRRYASMVYRKGLNYLDSLPKNDKKWIAPLPIKYDGSLSQYQKMKEMMGGHGGDNFPKAQAIKDATMAHSILKNLKENTLFVHYNGSYHSNYYEGIFWYLKQHNILLNIVTLSIVEQENVKNFDKKNRHIANFIIVTPTTMTKTY